MFATIQGKMVAIFLGFVLLLAAGATASYLVLTRQADDGLIVNLAGRQRMLTQKMTKEALQLQVATAAQDADAVRAQRDQLQKTMQVFDTTLLALKDGGPAPLNLTMNRMREVPAATEAKLKSQLERVASLWQPFRSNLDRLLQSDGLDPSSAQYVSNRNVELLTEMNSAVSMMQAASESKVQTLYMVQGLALGIGLLLVAIGAGTARSTISKPIVELSEAARKMSTGDLSVEFMARGTREVEALSESFDRMRASMVAAFEGDRLAATGTDDDL